MNLLTIVGPGGLIPKIQSTCEVLDINYNPCVYTGNIAGSYKGDCVYIIWLGMVYGYVKNKRELEKTDYEYHQTEIQCPYCTEGEILGNKTGELACTHCDLKTTVFEESPDFLK